MSASIVQTYLVVMLGGALGSALRMWLSLFIASRHGETFPVGTLVVNVLGSCLIGVYAGLTGPQGIFIASPTTRQFVMIGVLGGFTTFSSFSLQTYYLLTDGEWLRASLNAVLSVVICLVAVWIGMVLAAWVNQR